MLTYAMVDNVVLFSGLKINQVHLVLYARADIVIVTGEETRIKISTDIQPVIQASHIVEVVTPAFSTRHIAIHAILGI